MSRPIDADALIVALKRKAPISDAMRVMLAECLEEVRHAPTIELKQKNGGWIPCSERLPEDGQDILIQMLFGKMSVIKFNADGLTSHIIAWMPLPEPWRGEEHETD